MRRMESALSSVLVYKSMENPRWANKKNTARKFLQVMQKLGKAMGSHTI